MSAGLKRIHIYEIPVNGEKALGFDTGLDSRSFAQARFAQFLSEPGYIVDPSGSVSRWKASGVIEAVNPTAGNTATMHIYGSAFVGTRLDLLLYESEKRDAAFAAVINWIDAQLALEAMNIETSRWPCAAFISDCYDGQQRTEVFLAPESLVRRCIFAEGEAARLSGCEQYIHPDRGGADAGAFTAAAMLYRVFTGSCAFSALHEETLRTDIREGNFLPIQLAAPGIEPALTKLIQEALAPVAKNAGDKGQIQAAARQNRPPLLRRIRESLNRQNQEIAAYFQPLSEAELSALSEEKEKLLHRNAITVNARRFVTRNTAILTGIGIALALTIFFAVNIARTRAAAPSTAGMDSFTVVSTYYEALDSLDHQTMAACTAKGAGKSDISMATNFFVITRVRQAYEHDPYQFISPQKWIEDGKMETDKPVFGIMDLRITHLSGYEDSENIRYRSSYTLWLPMSETDEKGPSSCHLTDDILLSRIRGNWRITEMVRAENKEQ